MFFKRVQPSVEGFFLPSSIEADLIGVANAIKGKRGVNKFLFEGAPGTGKTEAVRQLSRVLHRDLYAVAFDNIVDSKLGQTTKNVASLFQEIRDFPHPDHIMAEPMSGASMMRGRVSISITYPPWLALSLLTPITRPI